MPTSLSARGAIRGIGGNEGTGENSFQGSFPPDKVAVRKLFSVMQLKKWSWELIWINGVSEEPTGKRIKPDSQTRQVVKVCPKLCQVCYWQYIGQALRGRQMINECKLTRIKKYKDKSTFFKCFADVMESDVMTNTLHSMQYTFVQKDCSLCFESKVQSSLIQLSTP